MATSLDPGKQTTGDFKIEGTLAQPLTAGMTPLPIYDVAGIKGKPVFTVESFIDHNPDTGETKTYHPGSGDGLLVIHPSELEDYHLYGSGVTPDSEWPSDLSEVTLLLHNVAAAGSVAASFVRLAFGVPLRTTIKPGSGAYFELDPGIGNLTLKFTSADGSDSATAGDFIISGDVDVSGNLTVGELVVAPTGVEFTQQANNPGGTTANTIYINSGTGHLTRNELDLENAANINMARVSGSTFFSVQDMQDIFHSAGHTTGGTINDAGSANITADAGTGLVRVSASLTAEIQWINWDALGSTAIPADTIRYVGVEYNGGTPQIVVHTTYDWNFLTDFPLGSVVNEGGALHISNASHRIGDHASEMIKRVWGVSPIARDDRVGGLILGETGTRNITVSAGTLWERLTAFDVTALDTSSSGDFATEYRKVGDSGWNTGTATQWPNTQYDDNSGTLADMTNNRYAVLWFYSELDGDIVMVYGQAQYTSSALAEGASPPSSVPPRLADAGLLIGRLIFRKSASTAEAIESVFTTTFATTLANDHGNLDGLADDDHTQYLNETRHDALSADNPHSVTLTQSVTADAGTDISAAELETLSDGSNADALHVHAGGAGDVVGPGSATDGNFALFDGTTGKLLKDGPAVGSLASLSAVNNGNWSGTDLAILNGGTGASTSDQAIENLINGATLESAIVAADILMMKDFSGSHGAQLTYSSFIGEGKSVTIAYTGSGSSGKQVTLTGINRASSILWYKNQSGTRAGRWAVPNGTTGTTTNRRFDTGAFAASELSLSAGAAGVNQVLTINTTSVDLNQSGVAYLIVVIGTPI